MTPRRFLILLFVGALVLCCPACAFAPDRWTLSTERDWDTRTGKPTEQKLGASISGPIPPLTHE